ncbi:hypothetical protein HYH03_002119 [Edaphochlamys debaryana]|uniref:Protein kinase domain-containing protein n=1 Tax=Edaphochlamys debaryana TaxID=47281 RepID=A0A836C5C2_9CHLO|nr:hypothetical protein HYH03_002119 [Edaphochlamys debaryana]|eukprot:KAG2499828.1 hypothetical protein HYH03_002119 [Edaphochlamys debaryana]
MSHGGLGRSSGGGGSAVHLRSDVVRHGGKAVQGVGGAASAGASTADVQLPEPTAQLLHGCWDVVRYDDYAVVVPAETITALERTAAAGRKPGLLRKPEEEGQHIVRLYGVYVACRGVPQPSTAVAAGRVEGGLATAKAAATAVGGPFFLAVMAAAAALGLFALARARHWGQWRQRFSDATGDGPFGQAGGVAAAASAAAAAVCACRGSLNSIFAVESGGGGGGGGGSSHGGTAGRSGVSAGPAAAADVSAASEPMASFLGFSSASAASAAIGGTSRRPSRGRGGVTGPGCSLGGMPAGGGGRSSSARLLLPLDLPSAPPMTSSAITSPQPGGRGLTSARWASTSADGRSVAAGAWAGEDRDGPVPGSAQVSVFGDWQGVAGSGVGPAARISSPGSGGIGGGGVGSGGSGALLRGRWSSAGGCGGGGGGGSSSSGGAGGWAGGGVQLLSLLPVFLGEGPTGRVVEGLMSGRRVAVRLLRPALLAAAEAAAASAAAAEAAAGAEASATDEAATAAAAAAAVAEADAVARAEAELESEAEVAGPGTPDAGARPRSLGTPSDGRGVRTMAGGAVRDDVDGGGGPRRSGGGDGGGPAGAPAGSDVRCSGGGGAWHLVYHAAGAAPAALRLAAGGAVGGNAGGGGGGPAPLDASSPTAAGFHAHARTGPASAATAAGQRAAQEARAGGVSQALAREAEALARLCHPGLVRLLGLSLELPRPLIVYELMETSLQRWLYGGGLGGLAGGGCDTAAGTPLELTQLLHVAAQVTAALAFLHSRKTVYGDLRPAHVLLSAPYSSEPVAKLASPALPRPRRGAPEAETASYQAPETYLSTHATPTAKADVYSLGVVLWELAAGCRPWAGASAEQIAMAVTLHRSRPPLRGLPASRCPPRLATLIGRCWEQAPERRPPATEVAAELLALHTAVQAGSLQR